MVTTSVYEHHERVRSYELVAEVAQSLGVTRRVCPET